MPPPSRPDRYEDAVAYFRARVPMKKAAFEKLTAAARSKAFTVAGLGQLDMVQQVWEAVDRAIARGETLEAFRKRVLPSLESAWGQEIPGRIETIFRTNVQFAYSAGRRAQMLEPAVLKARPYWTFSAVLDSRTTKTICLPLAKARIVLPAKHSWWKTHMPPLHFRCRSLVRNLRPEEARRLGITKKPPRELPQEGFGTILPLDNWKPDVGRYAKPLVKKYRARR